MLRKLVYSAVLLAAAAALCSVSAQEPPQPDQVLYDHAISSIRQNRFEVARLTLGTLINTYTESALLPRAHLAVAESWYRQGGPKNRAQAQNECKQIIQAYPGTPEAKQADQMLRKIDR